MSKGTGDGRWEHFMDPENFLLYNFDINGDQLKREHGVILLAEVVPILESGGSVTIIGLASRSGSATHNQALSKRRAYNTLAFLQKETSRTFAARYTDGIGETMAEAQGSRDGTEDDRFRAVVILTSRSPTPPAPPKKVFVPPAKPRRTIEEKTYGAKDRTLVVLLENGGIKIDIAKFLLKLQYGKSLTAHKLVMPNDVVKLVSDYIKNRIKEKTDYILESAELLLNRFNSAKPIHYGEVKILRDSSARYTDLKNALINETKAGKIIDLFILTHGGRNKICVEGSIDSKKIQDIKKENGNKSINLRIVYMMNCYGSLLNTAWLNIGARACSGATDINYLPEPFMYLFWTNWKKGQSFKDAVENAYKTSIEMIETIIRSAPSVGFYLSASIDVKNLAFVKSTKPIVVGQGSLTINSA